MYKYSQQEREGTFMANSISPLHISEVKVSKRMWTHAAIHIYIVLDLQRFQFWICASNIRVCPFKASRRKHCASHKKKSRHYPNKNVWTHTHKKYKNAFYCILFNRMCHVCININRCWPGLLLLQFDNLSSHMMMMACRIDVRSTA